MKKVVVFCGGLFLLVIACGLGLKGISFPAIWIVGGVLSVASGLVMLGNEAKPEPKPVDQEQTGRR